MNQEANDSHGPERPRADRLAIILPVIGAFGFLLMFAGVSQSIGGIFIGLGYGWVAAKARSLNCHGLIDRAVVWAVFWSFIGALSGVVLTIGIAGATHAKPFSAENFFFAGLLGLVVGAAVGTIGGLIDGWIKIKR